ncbi:hypothetical protein CYY_005628 [Polysphondylium violaceum]|uniref:Spindle pole body component n=1 Tax=Polysphondylium violaceum TaxID=133409 RepID=A0A8J4PSK2_9MYCE|nr:hypothetical protein CYY_005628 [Polysphondylium violaceum]
MQENINITFPPQNNNTNNNNNGSTTKNINDGGLIGSGFQSLPCASDLLPSLMKKSVNRRVVTNPQDAVSAGDNIFNFFPFNNDTTPVIIPAVAKPNYVEIPEELLTRDIIYVFQGIDGNYIKFNKDINMFLIDDHATLNNHPIYISKPKRDLISRLCEFGWLFRKITNFINNTQFKESGLTNKSLCLAINDELIELYRLIAILESQINKSIKVSSPIKANNNNSNGILTAHFHTGNSNVVTAHIPATSSTPQQSNIINNNESNGYNESNLTLRRMFVWCQEPLQKLKLLGTLVDAINTETMKGGEILSVIESLSKHGDIDQRQMTFSMLCKVSQPLFNIIKIWIFKGEIQDPYKEFFIKENPKVALEKVWREKFTIVARLIPKFISTTTCKRIAVVGKSINYMKQFCERDVIHQIDMEAIQSKSVPLGYHNIEFLDEIIDQVSKQSSQRLLKIVINEFKFMEHCRALKKYLLLGQGDFIQYLMDLVAEDLLQPVQKVMRHKLVGWMETAIRNSNVQFDKPEFVNRLDISLLQDRPGSIGWDIFSLDYHVDTPLNTILSVNDIVRYKKIFHFLWGVKRVEYSLNSVWRKMRSSNNTLRLFNAYIATEIHQSHLIMNEMIHFISNFQYYIMFEVFECCWKNLENAVQHEAMDLDQLIDSHHQYLHDICTKIFLSNSESCYECFKKLLSIIIKFVTLQNNLILLSNALNNSSPQQEQQALLSKELLNYKNHLHRLYQDYTSTLFKFQHEISLLKINQDLNPISLSYMLDFNEYYLNKHLSSKDK